MAPVGTQVDIGQTLFTIYAGAEGELNYALDYLKSTNHMIKIE
jgi:thymidine phosphorylase